MAALMWSPFEFSTQPKLRRTRVVSQSTEFLWVEYPLLCEPGTRWSRPHDNINYWKLIGSNMPDILLRHTTASRLLFIRCLPKSGHSLDDIWIFNCQWRSSSWNVQQIFLHEIVAMKSPQIVCAHLWCNPFADPRPMARGIYRLTFLSWCQFVNFCD